MRCAPYAQTDARAQQACDYERQQQVECDSAEPEPHMSVRRKKRNECVLPADRREPVDHRRYDMHGDEDDRQQRQGAMQPGDGEPR